MKKGGYQIIDLENRNFEALTAKTYDGMYDIIEGTRKPILVSGIQYDGVEYHDAFAHVRKKGTTFELVIAENFIVTVQDTDTVRIAKT